MAVSPIEWTDWTWNPTTGCDKVSPGCKHCYAERMALRLKAMGSRNYKNGFRLALQPQMLDAPLKLRRPRMIFVNSMSDLFHEDVPFDYLLRVFDVMRRAHWHTFQVLTKRSDRLARMSGGIDWPPNVWMGVSIENSDYMSRAVALGITPAQTKFLSCEPLLGPIDLRDYLRDFGIHWVIVGGESGPNARSCELDWIRAIVAECRRQKVPVFVKQLGRNPFEGRGVTSKKSSLSYISKRLRLKDAKGGDPREWPEDLRVIEYPSVAGQRELTT